MGQIELQTNIYRLSQAGRSLFILCFCLGIWFDLNNNYQKSRCTAQQNSARASSAAADTSENPLVAATAAANAAAAATASPAADAAAASTSPAAADIKQVQTNESSQPTSQPSSSQQATGARPKVWFWIIYFDSKADGYISFYFPAKDRT